MKEEKKCRIGLPGNRVLEFDSLDVAALVIAVILFLLGTFNEAQSLFACTYLPGISLLRKKFDSTGSKIITLEKQFEEKEIETDFGSYINSSIIKFSFMTCCFGGCLLILVHSMIFKTVFCLLASLLNLGVCMSFAWNVFIPCALLLQKG
jgi:hypothetical protein